VSLPVFALNLDKLSDDDIQMIKRMIPKLQLLIKAKEADSTIPTLTFDELYAPLDSNEQKFIKQFQKIKGKKAGIKIPWRGMSESVKLLVAIRDQRVQEKVKVTENGVTREEIKERTLPKQFLPLPVYQKYNEMMEAMEKDIGRRLLVDSGYRSSAFQLYLFVYYLQNHGYSIRETVKFVTLPGYSEHGDPKHQAIDFINKEGINGDPNVKEFEVLPENQWLLENARRFGFILSYPKNNLRGITYEPWHWRYDPKAAEKETKKRRKGKSRRSVPGMTPSQDKKHESLH